MYDPFWITINYIAGFILLYANIVFLALLMRYHKLLDWLPRPLSDDELPIISVVIPMYNEGERVRYGLDSLLDSDYPNEKYEIIVVDDCSTDNSYEIAKEYEKYGVKVVKTPKNGGAAVAKNYGFNIAKGQYIATIDSDAMVHPKTMRKMVAYFQEEGVAAVSAAVRVYNLDNILLKAQAIEYDVILFLRRLIMGLESVYVTPGGLSMFDASVFKEIGGFKPQSLTEDQEIAINIQKNGYKIRSSMDAFSYVFSPPTVLGLIKQRVRWVRGGLWNKYTHRDLFSHKSGDFLFFGILADFLYCIPMSMLLLSMIRNLVVEGFSPSTSTMFDASLMAMDPMIVTTIVVTIIIIPFTIYMVNKLRSNAGVKLLSYKEMLSVVVFVLVYGYLLLITWAWAIYKELRGGGYEWATRK